MKAKNITTSKPSAVDPAPAVAVSEKDKKNVQTLKLDPAMFERLRDFSYHTRRTKQEILLAALTDYLDRHK
jgi:hypothetical protein